MLFEKQRVKLQKASIRYIIFIYFTLTALAASIFIGISLYSRLSGQMSATIREENQILINQITRSMEDYLRTVMKLSDSLYYGVVKNADLASGSIGSEMTLLYDNNKDNVENIALLSKEGKLLEAVPAARLKTNVDVTGENWFTSTLEKTENMHFSTPHVQYIFDGSENQYRWVISLSRAVEITQGPSTDEGVLLIDIRYSSLEQLFDGVNLGNGGYVYLISSSGEIRTGVDQLAQGAKGASGQLAEGVKSLKEGSVKLQKALEAEAAGAKTLAGYTKDLNDGIASAYNGADKLAAGTSTLNTSTGKIAAGTAKLGDGETELNDEGIGSIAAMYDKIANSSVDSMNSKIDAAKAYRNYAGAAKDADTTVKFIIRSEGI